MSQKITIKLNPAAKQRYAVAMYCPETKQSFAAYSDTVEISMKKLETFYECEHCGEECKTKAEEKRQEWIKAFGSLKPVVCDNCQRLTRVFDLTHRFEA